MKSRLAQTCLVPLFAAFYALGAIPASEAAVILTIDISNPAQALFSSTIAKAQNDDLDDTWVNEGFTLVGFFNAATPFGGVYYSFDSSTIRSPGATGAYTDMFVVDISGDDRDLNISGSNFRAQNFSTEAQALSGSARVDLRDWLAYITLGTTGNILAGDNRYNTVVIGQFQVIPEPSSLSLIAGALLLCGGFRPLTRRLRHIAR